MMSHIWENR